MSILEIDCTERVLPKGILVAPCRRFEGLCVQSRRGFAPGELVCRYPLHLVDRETDVRFLTAHGVRHANFEDHGIELSPDLLEELPQEMLAQISTATGTSPADYEAMFLQLTDHGARCFVIGLDDMFNHAADANCSFGLAFEATSEGDSVQPWGEIRACRPIAREEELTLDYATFYGPSWAPPREWS